MATPDERGKRTWRFRLNDTSILEVSTPPRATAKQVRRRGRWSIIAGTLIAALMVSAVAYADQIEADADAAIEAVPHGNSASATQAAGTTVGYDFSAQIVNTPPNTGANDNDVFEAAGSCTTAPCAVNVSITRGGDWLGSPDAGSPASFVFTSYLTPQDGKIKVTVPSTTPCGTTKTMTVALAATATNGRTLNPNSVNLSYVISTPACSGNTAPVADAGAGVSGNEGSAIELDGSGSSDSDGTIASYAWTVDTTGIDSGGACSFDDATAQKPKVTCDDDSDNATGSHFTATLTVTDDDGATDTDDVNVTVSNVLPSVTFDASSNGTNPTSVNENADATAGQVTYSYTISDPGTNDTVDAVNTSCGSNGVKVVGSDSESDTAGSFKCIFRDGDDPPAGTDTTLSAAASDDDDSAFGTADTLLVNIQNVAPTLTSLGAGSSANCGLANSLTINFSDPALAYDTYFASIDWGDGNTSTPTGISSGYVAMHVYATAGPHTVSVTVSDDDLGTSASMQQTLIVNYNTSGVLQPVNWTQAQNNPSIFKWGSTIPVKIEFTDCNGTSASGLSVKIAVKKITSATPTYGDNESITNTNSPDSGGYMRWVDSKYLYNLNTKSLADKTATYHIVITVESTGQTVETDFGTREK